VAIARAIAAQSRLEIAGGCGYQAGTVRLPSGRPPL